MVNEVNQPPKIKESSKEKFRRYFTKVVESSRYVPRRVTPSQQQRFYKTRARVLRGVQTIYPQQRYIQSQGSGVRTGRVGRPKGSFKYYIPGKGQVDVFTYRRWASAQRNLARQQFQQNFAKQKAYRQAYREEFPQQQFQQMPTQQIPTNIVPPVQPSLKEISVLERTPLTLGMETQDVFVERDLATGQPKFKRRGFLL